MLWPGILLSRDDIIIKFSPEPFIGYRRVTRERSDIYDNHPLILVLLVSVSNMIVHMISFLD